MTTVAATISSISSLQATHSPSILKLAEPLINTGPTPTSEQHEQPLPTPQSLRTDLEHYKILFSKLRFSYLEQVTKEKFLRSIVGDPPLIVENADCAELEVRLVEEKSKLKAQKEEVRVLIEELERAGSEVSRRYNTLHVGGQRLSVIEDEIEAIHQGIADFRAQLPDDDQDLRGWPLTRVQENLLGKQRELQATDRRLTGLRSDLPERSAELDTLKREMQQLEVQRLGSMAAADDAQKRKEGRVTGGTGDEVEERARWLRAQEAILISLLEVG